MLSVVYSIQSMLKFHNYVHSFMKGWFSGSTRKQGLYVITGGYQDIFTDRGGERSPSFRKKILYLQPDRRSI